jgi:uncharacterized repeat protein (TIGR01451 family)
MTPLHAAFRRLFPQPKSTQTVLTAAPKARPRVRLARLWAVLIPSALLALSLYSGHAASASRAARRGVAGVVAPAADTGSQARGLERGANGERGKGLQSAGGVKGVPYGMLFFFASESVSTFAADCSTPSEAFTLGQTACAQITGAPVLPGRALRRLVWVDPDGFTRRSTNVTSSTQFDSFNIPSTPTSVVGGVTVHNRGTWRVVDVDTTSGGARSIATFTVSDPANKSADLSVTKLNANGRDELTIGGNVTYKIIVRNAGPDAATNVHLTDAIPDHTSWVSATQASGFTCTNPTAGATSGTTDCSIASLPKGAEAEFTFVYLVDGGTPEGTIVTNTAEVAASTTTPDPNTVDNSSSSEGRAINAPICNITVPDPITVNNEAGQGGAHVTYSAPTATNCGPVSCAPVSGSFFSIGTTTVVCTDNENDPVGFDVTVNDTQPPSVSCPADITVAESSAGSGHANVNFTLPTATDNDPRPSTVTSSPASGSQFDVGTTTVTVTATDASGHNSTTCTFKVTVTASNCSLACPSNITVTESAPGAGADVNYPDPTTSGSCGAVTYDVPSGSHFGLGTTLVTATAAGGESCRFNVTVTSSADTEPPVISCPANIVQAAQANSCAASVNVGAATATDNKPGVTVEPGERSDGQPLSAPYTVGETIITWTATDAAGNTASCAQSVKITENVPPSVNAPAPVTVAVNASCDDVEVPNFVASLVATDNCTPSASLEISQSPAAETPVGVGAHTVTITVKDASNNVTTVTTTFNVVDNTPPTITAPPDVTVNADAASCSVSGVALGTPTTGDNCPGTSVTNNAPASFPLGVTSVTWTVKDAGNNTATATQKVTVVDHTPPSITLNGANPMTVECHTSFSDPGAAASDACSGNVAVSSSNNVNENVPGSYTVTYTATDTSNNMATATRTVNVVDTTPPTLTLNGQTISMWPPNHKYHTFNVTDFVTGVSDGCNTTLGIGSVVIEKVTSDEAENSGGDGNTLNDIVIAANCKSVQLRSERDGGGNGRVYTITFRVRDASGNTTRKTAKVVVPQNGGNSTAVDSGVAYTVNGGCP